jgi:hypothetical protein
MPLSPFCHDADVYAACCADYFRHFHYFHCHAAAAATIVHISLIRFFAITPMPPPLLRCRHAIFAAAIIAADDYFISLPLMRR